MKRFKKYILALVLLPIYILTFGRQEALAKEVVRISGSNRYETSKAINAKFKQADTAIIVNGKSFADSLSASNLAAISNAPIYIDSNVDVLRGEFERLGVKKVFIVGGFAAVSGDIGENLSSDYQIIRLAGSNRYETSKAVTDYLGLENTVIVTGQDYKDAMLASNLIKAKKAAIRLNDSEFLPEHTNIKYVIGNNKINRQETTYTIDDDNVADKAIKILDTMNKKSNLIIASEKNFADALSAIGALESLDAQLVLIDGQTIDSKIIELANSYKTIYLVGGERTITSEVEGKLRGEKQVAPVTPEKTESPEVEEPAYEDNSSVPFIWPVPTCDYITEYFIQRIHPTRGTYEQHIGLDIGAGYGENIVATKSGKVILAGPNGNYGNCVIIDHGGSYTSLYAHMGEVYVGVGEEVSQGQVLGPVGSTGLSTGPHLHFEIRKDGVYQDPLAYVNFGNK